MKLVAVEAGIGRDRDWAPESLIERSQRGRYFAREHSGDIRTDGQTPFTSGLCAGLTAQRAQHLVCDCDRAPCERSAVTGLEQRLGQRARTTGPH